MYSRKQILQKMKLFYDEVKYKRKSKTVRLQVDKGFLQVKIKDLNDQKNVHNFCTWMESFCCGTKQDKNIEIKCPKAKNFPNKNNFKLT